MKESDRPTTCCVGACVSDVLSRDEIPLIASMLKALAHPVRLRMIDLISSGGGELCVCEFETHFELSQPTISHHLKILRDAGLIRSRQDGTWVRHAIDPDSVESLSALLSRLAHQSSLA